MKSVLPVMLGLSAATALCGCVVVDSQAHITREEKRFAVTGAPELRLTTVDGAIDVRAGDDKEVVVEIEKRGPTLEGVAQLTVATKQDGNHIEIEVKRPAREQVFFGIGSTPTARLIVRMPRGGSLAAKSGDGSITLEGVQGRLDLRTGDGSIRVRGSGGQLTFATGDGSVTLDDTTGTVDGETGDGSVSVTGVPGAVRVRTGDGSITLRVDSGTRMTDDWSLTTGDGGVAIYLPKDFAADLDAHSGDSIRNDLAIRAEAGDDTHSRSDEEKRTLRTQLGAGGKTLKIRTGDGSIRLKAS